MHGKYILVSLFLLFLVSLGRDVHSEEIWSLGTEDKSFREFALAGNVADYAKTFPTDPIVRIGAVDIGKEFPWIFPGTSDPWAGKKSHTITVDFDLDEKHLAEGDGTAFEILITAMASYWRPKQTMLVNLNGVERRIDVPSGCYNDVVLVDPSQGTFVGCRAVFFKNTLKKTGNRLVITNVSPAWFLLDSIRCVRESENVQKMTFSTRQTLLKGESGQLPCRELALERNGCFFAEKTTLILQSEQNEKIVGAHEYQLEPEKQFTLDPFPVSVQDPDAAAKIKATFRAARGKEVVTMFELAPVRHWEVHMLHHTHLDIGYTEPQNEILERQVRSIYETLRYIDETKDYPDEAKFKFHLEGMWAVDEFFERSTEEDQRRFIDAARNRQIYLDGMYAQALTGMYNDEELFHVMDAATEFGRKHGVTVDSAMITDIPGWTWGYVTALAQHGIKYLDIGASRRFALDDKPFYWESPSGKEKVLCLAHSLGYGQFHDNFRGDPLPIREKILPALDVMSERGYPYDVAIFRYSIEADNGPPNRIASDTIRDWNAKYVWPRMILSRNSDAMKALENRYGKSFPVYKGDMTPYWEDGAASTSEATALNRAAKERILQAETLWAMLKPNPYPAKKFQRTWIDLIMYDEHTWGANISGSDPDNPFSIEQDKYKQAFARRADGLSRELVSAALQPLTVKCTRPESSNYGVFNTLPWQRGDVVVLPINGPPGPADLVVHDLRNGRRNAAQFLSGDGCAVSIAPIAPTSSIILATESASPTFPVSKPFTADVNSATFSNGKITFVIDSKTGALSSLKLKGIDEELVNPGDDSNSGLNDYLYIIGRNPLENRERYASGVKICVEDIGPCVLTVRVESPVPNCESLVRKYRLYADSDRIEVENTMDKIKERRKEGTFFGFPFKIAAPIWRYDIPWAVAQVEKDQMPDANRGFFPVQRFCNVTNDRLNIDWVTLDAHMVQFVPIFSPIGFVEPPRRLEPNGTLYSWVCSNHWPTNYKADQEGILKFRYVIRPRSGSFDAANSQRFAREIHRPLIAIKVDDRVKPSPSLLTLSNHDVVTTTIRPAKKGNGLIVRLFNPTSKPQSTTLTSPTRPSIFLSNVWEDRYEPVSTTIHLAPWESLTVRME